MNNEKENSRLRRMILSWLELLENMAACKASHNFHAWFIVWCMLTVILGW